MRCPHCGCNLELALFESDANLEASEVDQITGQMREARSACGPGKPGGGEAAAHIVDHLGLKGEIALAVLRRVEGQPDIDRELFRQLVRNGRRRPGRCRFCPEGPI